MEHTPVDTLQLQLDPDVAAAFQSAAKWARFIAIVFFIFIGFVAVMMLFALAMNAGINTLGDVGPGLQFGLVIMVLIPVTLLIIQLYRFANRTRDAIQRQDQEMLNRGLRNLRIYLSVYGILSMIGIVSSVYNLIKAF